MDFGKNNNPEKLITHAGYEHSSNWVVTDAVTLSIMAFIVMTLSIAVLNLNQPDSIGIHKA